MNFEDGSSEEKSTPPSRRETPPSNGLSNSAEDNFSAIDASDQDDGDESYDGSIEKTPPPVRKKSYDKMVVQLNEEYFDDMEVNAKEICSEKTFHTPKKRKIEGFSLETPLKNHVDKIEFYKGDEVIEATPIFSQDDNFCEGKKSFIDVLLPNTNVGIDCDHADWDKLAESYFGKFVGKLKPKTEQQFIATLIHHIKENKDHLKDTSKIFFQKGLDEELVCRHYATFALPIIARILKHKNNPFKGTIHQMASTKIDHNYMDITGHAWNVIRLKDEKDIEHIWALDFYNSLFTNVSREKSLEKMFSCSSIIKDDKITVKKTPLSKDKFFYPYVKVVKEKLDINMGGKITPYNDDKTIEAMSSKRVLSGDFNLLIKTDVVFNSDK